MIEFSCRCKHHFSLPDDQAGGMIQCPSCHLLVDIPTLSDLEHIDNEGSYKLDESIAPLTEPERLSILHRVYTRRHTEDDGSEIDLRPTMQDVMDAGVEEIPLALADHVRPAPPKYDPATGELIRPIDVKPGDERVDPAAVPMAQRAVEYAGADLNPRLGIGTIGFQLLQPVNLFVMLLILLGQILLQPLNLLLAAGMFLIAPVWLGLVMIITAHYANVVEDTGPAEFDELPRPLRDGSFVDDIWRPFTHIGGAFILCYGWVLLAWRLDAPAYVSLGLMLAGSFFFPAVLLTLTTSGTTLNLRPDRVLGVIRVCGLRYFAVVGLFVAADVTYGLGLWRFQFDSQQMFRFAGLPQGTGAPWWFQPYSAYPALIGGIFLMHWFCWTLGAMYRVHHGAFPWVLQRHIPTRLNQRTLLPPGARRPANANSAAVKEKLNVR